MKILFSLIASFTFLAVNAQVSADDILGKWKTDEDKSVVEIFKKGDKYFGKVVSLKEPYEEDGTEKLDKNNPDESLRSRKIKGMVLLMDFVFDDEEWEDGEIYDPESGNTYSCEMTLDGQDLLKVRGYIGFSWIGRTTEWRRVK
ncbi:MAG TPA: DUF2147 domain-containing protein [Flavobacteriales bacterium]|jgi:uncharacterized protein (DUF2147 family)|nr:DUF2147 domain-containing protein [Flavobacteriales bacterium]